MFSHLASRTLSMGVDSCHSRATDMCPPPPNRLVPAAAQRTSPTFPPAPDGPTAVRQTIAGQHSTASCRGGRGCKVAPGGGGRLGNRHASPPPPALVYISFTNWPWLAAGGEAALGRYGLLKMGPPLPRLVPV